MQQDKQNIRTKLLHKRANLDLLTQQQAAENILHQLHSKMFFNQAQHIAVYYATNNELNLDLVIDEIWQTNKRCYLPCLQPDSNKMLFGQYSSATQLKRAKHGIMQPHAPSYINMDELDLILVPGVGFTQDGIRLGMGGGYYDRALSPVTDKSATERPYICGIAYSAQMQDSLPNNMHDVVMDDVMYV